MTGKKCGHAAILFVGPVSNAVKGELNQEERKRALFTGLAKSIATGAGVVAVFGTTEMLTNLVVPIVMTAFFAGWDALARLNQGATPPAPLPDLPHDSVAAPVVPAEPAVPVLPTMFDEPAASPP